MASLVDSIFFFGSDVIVHIKTTFGKAIDKCRTYRAQTYKVSGRFRKQNAITVLSLEARPHISKS